MRSGYALKGYWVSDAFLLKKTGIARLCSLADNGIVQLAIDTWRRWLFGVREDGFMTTIRAVGFSGTAATIWAAGCPTRICGKSDDGARCVATLSRFSVTASSAILAAGAVNARLCSIGHTTAESYDCPLRPFQDVQGRPDKNGCPNAIWCIGVRHPITHSGNWLE